MTAHRVPLRGVFSSKAQAQTTGNGANTPVSGTGIIRTSATVHRLPVRAYSAADNTTGWNEQVIALDAYTGQTVRIRFLLVTAAGGSSSATWTVDTIVLQPASVPTPSPVPSQLPTPTPTITPTLASSGWITYQDTDPLLTVEAAVHEMGHVFDARSGSFGNQVAETSVVDCRQIAGNVFPPYTIFGNASEGWIRGQHGWGDSALNDNEATQISRFQQNPEATYYETAADMFLNWVYRRTSGTAELTTNWDDACFASDIGNWEGFQNIDEWGDLDLYQDSQDMTQNTRSGNRRYWWMHITY